MLNDQESLLPAPFLEVVTTLFPKGYQQSVDAVIGMYYDIDSVLSSSLRLEDDAYVLKIDTHGILDVKVAHPKLLTPKQCRSFFLRILNRIAFNFVVYQQEQTETDIVYWYCTGNQRLFYIGCISFKMRNADQL